MNAPVGTVYLVGAGPGAPNLITVRGRALLERADVVVYDHLVHPRLIDSAPPGAERLAVGKRAGHYTVSQDGINALLVDRARQGLRVVRLKGGDPFVFGRGAEEAEHLAAAGVPFEVVPGVTAGVGAASLAGLCVTHRADSSAVAFVTGHHDPNQLRAPVDWPALARFPGTLVIYMGATRLPTITEALLSAGRSPQEPAAFVHWGSLPCQRVVEGTLATLAERVLQAKLGPPALIVIGDVVHRRAALAWYERLPLFGQRIVVTRPRDEGERIAPELEALGAEVLLAPTVEIRPLDDHHALDDAMRRLATFDWLVFTSENGVHAFIGRLDAHGLDLRALGHLKLAAIGPTTADALGRYHLKADLVPAEFRSESLAAALAERAAGQRVLLARANRGRDLLRTELQSVAHVEQVAVYRNVDVDRLPDHVAQRLEEGTVDWITLTSSAITERLAHLLPPGARELIGTKIQLASLSPVTTRAAERLGWTVSAEAQTYTWGGLVEAMLAQRRDHASSR